MAKKKKELSTIVVTFDPRKGIDIVYRGIWSRKMLDQVKFKMEKFHRKYKHELRRKEDERREKE